MNLHEVVTKLVGPIKAVGETNEDVRRFENLKALTNLVDRLLYDIKEAAVDAIRDEGSMKAIGLHAKNFIRDVQEAD
jgi:hypothetical protein